MADASRTVSLILRLVDRITGPARSVGRAIAGIGASARKESAAFKLADHMSAAANNVEQTSRSMVDAVKKPITTFADFESTMNRVRAVTYKGIVNPEDEVMLAKMAAAARQLGADTQFSASQAGEAMVVLATGGFKAQEQIDALRGTLDLAASGKVDMAEAAEISIVALRGFNLEAGEAGRVADVLTNTFTSSNTAISDIGEALKYVAPVAAGAGVELEKVTAMVGELGNVGIRGSQAGTSIRAMLTRLQAPSDKKAKSALAFLGINPRDKAGNLKPIEGLFEDISKAMDRRLGVGKGTARRAALLKAIFGEEAAAGAQALVNSAGKGSLQASIDSNMNAGGTASRVAGDMMRGAAGAAKELDSAVEELQLTLGESVIPQVTELAKSAKTLVGELAGWSKEHPTLTQGIMGTVAALGAIGLILAPVMKGVAALIAGAGYLKAAFVAVKGAVLLATTAFRSFALALLTNPITWIVVGIVALIAAGVALYKNWDQVKAFFVRTWDSLPGPVQSALRLISAPIRMLVAFPGWIVGKWGGVKGFFVGVWDDVAGTFTFGIGWIDEKTGVFTGMVGVIKGAWGGLNGFFVGVWDGTKGIVGTSIDWIIEKIEWVGSAIEDFDRSLPGWVTGREEELAGGALGRIRAVQGAAEDKAAGRATAVEQLIGGARAAIAGEIKISVDQDGKVKDVRAEAPGLALPINRGFQGA